MKLTITMYKIDCLIELQYQNDTKMFSGHCSGSLTTITLLFVGALLNAALRMFGALLNSKNVPHMSEVNQA